MADVQYASPPSVAAMPSMTPVENISQVCSGMGKGNLITGVLVDLMRKHFSTASNIEYAELRRNVWSPNDDTGILISPVTAWTPKLANQRPAVLVRRNKLTKQRVTIGDQRQMQPQNWQGFPHYTVVWGAVYTIFCLSSSAALQAEILATEVARELVQFHQVLIKDLGLMALDVTDIDEIRLLEGSRQTFFVPVNVFIAYSESWIVTSQAPPLRKFSTDALLHR